MEVTPMVSRDSLDLTNCDKEKIHLIGGVQEHGYFLAFRPTDRTVYHASQNIEALTGKPLSENVGASLTDLLPEAWSKKILAAALALKGEEYDYVRLPDWEVRLFAWDGLVAAEFEKSGIIEGDAFDVLTSAYKRNMSFVEDLHSSQTLEAAAKHVCRSIRTMIGVERVMMYRYLPSWDGEVIAEDKSPEAHSFMGHRFPATDIPLPARELYLKNRTRQIVDSSAGAVAIQPGDHYLTRKPIDLTHSKLRAVSPIHLQYLKNMGVIGSFSVAVIVEGQLWGLIACHGSTAQVIPHEIRLSCETLASTFGALANMMETLAKRSAHLKFEESLRKLFQRIRPSDSPVAEIFSNHSFIEEIFEASGIGLVNHNQAEIAGMTPPQAQTVEIAQWLRSRFQNEGRSTIAVESLREAKPEWGDLSALACGVLAFQPENDDSVFMIFRPELLRSVVWGGDPRKTMAKRGYEGPINPRLSFESWTETVSGHSAKWTPYQVQGATYMRDFVFDSLVKKERLIQELGTKLNLANRPGSN